MSQFASTLYPQTNPTNPILLAYREYDEVNAKVFRTWAPTMHTWTWGRFAFDPTESQIVHAQKVLIRLASFSG